MVPSIADPVDLYCDNNGAIAQAKEPRSHSKAKHILRRYHLLREINNRGDIHICKVHTNDTLRTHRLRLCRSRSTKVTLVPWVLDTWVIGSSASGRSLVLVP